MYYVFENLRPILKHKKYKEKFFQRFIFLNVCNKMFYINLI